MGETEELRQWPAWYPGLEGAFDDGPAYAIGQALVLLERSGALLEFTRQRIRVSNERIARTRRLLLRITELERALGERGLPGRPRHRDTSADGRP